MTGKPIVLFLDIPVVGPVHDLMAEVQHRTEIVGPPRFSPEAIEAAKASAQLLVVRQAELSVADEKKVLSENTARLFRLE